MIFDAESCKLNCFRKYIFFLYKQPSLRAVVVARLLEQSLPIPEFRGSNPVENLNLILQPYFPL